MNNIRLRDFPAKTLQQVSALIDKRTATIRNKRNDDGVLSQSLEEIEELENLLIFQTQTLWALQLVQKEELNLSN